MATNTTTVAMVLAAWERPVDSSFIDAVGWAKVQTTDGSLRRIVSVRIRGKRYPYDAPAWVLGLMLAADKAGRSVGRIYTRHLRNRFPLAVAEEAA